MHIGFWEGTLRERDHLEYQGEGGEIFRTYPDLPWGPPNLLYNWYRVFPGGKERPGRGVDPHSIYCRGPRKSRVMPLLTLRAFVACKRGETSLSREGGDNEALAIGEPTANFRLL